MLGKPSWKKMFSFGHCPNYLSPPPIRATCTTFRDNCDYTFGTFDNFGVKNDQKVSHYMMSRYMGQLHGGRGSKDLGKALPPTLSGNARKKTFFFPVRSSHTMADMFSWIILIRTNARTLTSVRGYLPASPETKANLMELNVEQETLRELSARKQVNKHE